MKKQIISALAAAAMAVTMISGTAMAADSTEAPAAAAPGEAAGFTEIPIFEDQECDFLNVSAVYFQPVPMAPDQENIEDFNLHLECDVSALENDLGYGVGDWVPYLTVDYKVTGSDDEVAAEGTFMEMSASDGPHYGANIKLDKADTYKVEFTHRNLKFYVIGRSPADPGCSASSSGRLRP